MFGSLGPLELGIIALIVILLFGVGKISGLGKELGSSIKEFRKAVKDEDGTKDTVVVKTQVESPPMEPAAPAANVPPVQPTDPQKNIF